MKQLFCLISFLEHFKCVFTGNKTNAILIKWLFEKTNL